MDIKFVVHTCDTTQKNTLLQQQVAKIHSEEILHRLQNSNMPNALKRKTLLKIKE